MAFLEGIERWLTRSLSSFLITLVALYGTLTAAYGDYAFGLMVFWVSIALNAISDSYWIYEESKRPANTARVYFGCLVSVVLNAIFGYGAAIMLLSYASSPEVTANPILASFLTPRVVGVFVLTSVAFTTLQICLALARAIVVEHEDAKRQPAPPPSPQPAAPSRRKPPK